MKRIDISAYGLPEIVARCVEVAEVGAPAPGEIVFDVLAFPINPADLSFCRGNYRLTPALPATPGAECVGRVAAVGSGVTGLRMGDLVINLQRENWVQRRRARAEDAVPLPPGLDLAQAAMVRINPPTAQLLLEDHVALAPGDWVIQDVANSAVGRHLIVLAKSRGLRTVNVVRRDDVNAELTALGADVVLKDGPDLAERARGAVGGAPIRLGIDAISGDACRRIGDCVAEGGVLVNYGSRSREAHAGAGARALCRACRQDPRWGAQGPDRFPLPDRGDREGAGSRAGGRASRQGAGAAERAALSVPSCIAAGAAQHPRRFATSLPSGGDG
jgi:trans-2-enoyl-CoA reductase